MILSINYKEFKNENINILFILGVHGAGKTILAKQLKEKFPNHLLYNDTQINEIKFNSINTKLKNTIMSIDYPCIVDTIDILGLYKIDADFRDFCINQSILLIKTPPFYSSLKGAIRNTKKGLSFINEFHSFMSINKEYWNILKQIEYHVRKNNTLKIFQGD